MNFKETEPEVISELLIFLAEHESFSSVKDLHGISSDDVRVLLKGLAVHLKEQALHETSHEKPKYSDLNLSPKAMALISSLSPREEMLLFKTFRVI